MYVLDVNRLNALVSFDWEWDSLWVFGGKGRADLALQGMPRSKGYPIQTLQPA